jgi:ribosomal protein S12 methylthiotransferase
VDAATTVTPARVAIVTLGCGRNEVDSEQLAGLLAAAGHDVVEDAASADAVLVNTCTFVAPATQESVDTVLAACDLKTFGAARAVLVVGCMAQRHPDELADAIPEADAIVGFGAYPRLATIVDDALAGRLTQRVHGIEPEVSPAPGAVPDAAPVRSGLPALPLRLVRDGERAGTAPTAAAGGSPAAGARAERGEGGLDAARADAGQDLLDRVPASGPRFPVRRRLTVDGRTTPWAYLKIASGCDRACTFCAIPSFRGRFRSRPLDELEAEARWLAAEGVRELVLVSENTTAWGKDLERGRDQQPELVRRLAAVEGVERLRLLYLQPAELTPALVEAMVAEPTVADYFDLSLQHASGPVVTRMARSGDAERFLAQIASIRAAAPDAVFRSNVILGFPGETEHDVSVLEDFLVEGGVEGVGLFPYSPEEGTPAASMPDQVPAELAAERVERVRAVQERVADEAARRFVGRGLTVLVEDDDPDLGMPVGRSYREGPDADGEVRLVGPGGLAVDVPTGRMVDVTVIAADGVDLIAEARG